MINGLRYRLLGALESDGDELISLTTSAILKPLRCDMCTLWSINHNTSPDSKDIGNYDSASLIIRCLKGKATYPKHNPEDFVHRLENTFIEHVLNECKRHGKSFFTCGINDEACKKHLSYDTLKEMGISNLICFPLWDKDREMYYAFAKLAYKGDLPLDEANIKIVTEIANHAIASALSRYQIYQKQQLLDDLSKNYSQNRSTLRDIFHPVINKVFKKYFDYEGASVFIWDSYENRYNLLSTTGLEPYDGDAYYENGEGLTSATASEKNAKIYDDLIHLERIKYHRYMHKYKEKTEHTGETLLTVPILRPSNPNDVVGIIRFTNKINKQSKKEGSPIIDHFNTADVELVKYASHYLALNVENYIAEEERRDFISKMSHEFKTPATAIRVTAERALRKYSTPSFMQTQFEHYMESIVDYSTLQLMQVSTNLFLTKSGEYSKFNNGSYSVLDILKASINTIRPIAREHFVSFDNIRIDEDFPNVYIKVDREAFIMVFYNLLTNAIKYHSNVFSVLFQARETTEGLMVYVSDKGIGIAEDDKERIFLLGVRSKRARQINSDGYGIGLHVVKLILNTFGGDIRVSHNQNPTTFEIMLPRSLFTNKF